MDIDKDIITETITGITKRIIIDIFIGTIWIFI